MNVDVLPGFINAHDHLEFNLFPTLGNGPYRNAEQWARDIHHPERSPVREHLRVPKPVRLWWGGLKNLLSGVTTVCHHNPYDASVFTRDFPVRVVRRFGWAHSLAFEPKVAERFRRAGDKPFVIHCAEGIGQKSASELDTLEALGALTGHTVIVHGVALRPRGIELLRRRAASLVWCPTSNLSMFGRTLSRTILRSGVPIALGTDSALSASVDLLDEMAVARRYVSETRVRDMVTTVPARILQLPTTRDWIGMRGDHIAAVSIRGRIRLIAPDLATPAQRRSMQPITLEGRPTVLVDAPVRQLRRAAARYIGSDVRLAGKRIL